MNNEQIGRLTEAALETIAKLVGVSDDKAAAALAAIGAIINALRDGTSGKLSPQAALTQIESLHAELAGQKAEAIAKLKERFNRE